MYLSILRKVIGSSALVVASLLPVGAQPLIVLEPSHSYSGGTTSGDMVEGNAFMQDLDYSAKHKVALNESLHIIMNRYYADAGIDKKFLQLAIVRKNSHAFVRANPNFLYAGKTLHLPSVNEIQAMILGKTNSTKAGYSGNSSPVQEQIYFHGF